MSFDWAKLSQDIPKEIAKPDDVPEEFRHLYDRDGQNGNYVFKGSKVLFASMTGAKTEREEFKTKLSGVEADLAKFSALGSYDDLKALHEKSDEIKNAQIAQSGQLDQLRAASQQQIATLEATKNTKIASLEDALRATVQDNLIATLIASASLTKEGQAIIPQLLPGNFKVELGDGNKTKVLVVDKNGQPRMNAKMDPMTPTEVIAELREQFPSLFNGSGNAGGGGGDTDNVVLPGDKKPSTWNPAQKAAYMREHGSQAYENLVRAEGAANSAKIQERLQASGRGPVRQ